MCGIDKVAVAVANAVGLFAVALAIAWALWHSPFAAHVVTSTVGMIVVVRSDRLVGNHERIPPFHVRCMQLARFALRR